MVPILFSIWTYSQWPLIEYIRAEHTKNDDDDDDENEKERIIGDYLEI